MWAEYAEPDGTIALVDPSAKPNWEGRFFLLTMEAPHTTGTGCKVYTLGVHSGTPIIELNRARDGWLGRVDRDQGRR